jgi:hypothetical protein
MLLHPLGRAPGRHDAQVECSHKFQPFARLSVARVPVLTDAGAETRACEATHPTQLRGWQKDHRPGYLSRRGRAEEKTATASPAESCPRSRVAGT